MACYWHPDWGHCPFPDHFLCRAKEEEKGKRCEMSEISLFKFFLWHVLATIQNCFVLLLRIQMNNDMKVHIFELGRMIWRYDRPWQLYTQPKQLKLKPEKNSGLNGIQTHELCNTGALLYQLSYQANWELATFWVLNIPEDGDDYKWIYETSYLWTAENDMKIWLIIVVMHTT